MTPPPPSSTLFPYTTLFRSLLDHGRPVDLAGRGHFLQARTAVVAELLLDGTEILLEASSLPTRIGDQLLKLFPLLDRKSTRLNSSHSQISYAVFCLKKKKTK